MCFIWGAVTEIQVTISVRANVYWLCDNVRSMTTPHICHVGTHLVPWLQSILRHVGGSYSTRFFFFFLLIPKTGLVVNVTLWVGDPLLSHVRGGVWGGEIESIRLADNKVGPCCNLWDPFLFRCGFPVLLPLSPSLTGVLCTDN